MSKKLWVFPFMMLLLAGIVLADTISQDNPTTDEFIRGTARQFNGSITYNTATGNTNITNVTVSNSTGTILGRNDSLLVNNNTVSTFSLLVSTTGQADGRTNLNYTFYDNSGAIASVSATKQVRFIIDNVQAVSVKLTSPATNTLVTGTVTANAEIRHTDTEVNVSSLNVTSVNGTILFCGNTSGPLAFNTSRNITCLADTSLIVDGNSIQFNYSIFNTDGKYNGKLNQTTANYTVDNTVPSCSISGTDRKLKEGSVLTFTSSDSLTSCRIQFGGNDPKTATISNEVTNTCTFTTGRDNPPVGNYEVKFKTNDGLNETTCSSFFTFTRQSGNTIANQIPSAIEVGTKQAVKQDKFKNIALAAVIVIIVIAVSGAGKGRKR